jgi:outer membrane lipoprotein-sorting protein
MNRITCSLALLLSLAAAAGAQTPAAGKKAGEFYKNVTVLKDVPQQAWIPTMNLIGASLGVPCEYCHATPYDTDTKPAKVTARHMIQMTLDINKANFDGKPVVTCNTCHQGSLHPGGTPAIWNKTPEQLAAIKQAAADQAKPPAPPAASTAALPTVEQIFANYRKAVGADSVKSIHMVGTLASDLQAARKMDVVAAFPDRFTFSLNASDTSIKVILVGDQAWSISPQGTAPMPAENVKQLKDQLLQVFRPVKFIDKEGVRRVTGTEKIGGRDCFVVELTTPAGVNQLYFDRQTGLLQTVRSETPTVLGGSRGEIAFEDYRDFSGIKMPIAMSAASVTDRATYRFTDIQVNPTLDPAAFQPPETKK